MNVPFYPNKKDNLHCFQAALRMVLTYFYSKRDFSYELLVKKTGYKSGLWTWPMKGLIYANQCGLKVERVSVFDYSLFAANPQKYLTEFSNSAVAEAQIQHSDISKAVFDAIEFEKRIRTVCKIPTLEMMKEYLSNNFLVICNVNSRAMNRKSGYVGHFIVVYRYTSKSIFFHDPGLPPKKGRFVRYNTFNNAWGYPSQKARNIYAFKL